MTPRSFLIKLFIFSLPFLLFVGIYFCLDPFKVFKHYDRYFESGQPPYVSRTKTCLTENWINHFPEFQYDSYIFGNSRSIYWQVNSWKNHIHRDASKCYHFDASGESLYGVTKKILFIDSRNVKIKNALLVIDYDVLHNPKPSEGHLFEKDPKTTGQNALAFQVDCLKDFFDFQFLTAYFSLKFTGKVQETAKRDYILDDRPFIYDYVTNEMRQEYYEEMIKKNPEDYYGPRKAVFKDRDTSVQQLCKSRSKNPRSNYSTPSPTCSGGTRPTYASSSARFYDQQKLNPADLLYLKKLFGEKNVFDFSGINAITNNVQNYYETSHYRPKVSDSLMKIIYAE